jgi:hypothetical protein
MVKSLLSGVLAVISIMAFTQAQEEVKQSEPKSIASVWTSISGNDLLPDCEAELDNLDKKNAGGAFALACLRYLDGFVQGYQTGVLAAGAKDIFCLPSGANLGQLVRIVVKWMKDNPAKLNQPASICVSHALVETFGCSGSK